MLEVCLHITPTGHNYTKQTETGGVMKMLAKQTVMSREEGTGSGS